MWIRPESIHRRLEFEASNLSLNLGLNFKKVGRDLRSKFSKHKQCVRIWQTFTTWAKFYNLAILWGYLVLGKFLTNFGKLFMLLGTF